MSESLEALERQVLGLRESKKRVARYNELKREKRSLMGELHPSRVGRLSLELGKAARSDTSKRFMGTIGQGGSIADFVFGGAPRRRRRR